jgi:hypothetical protein
LGYFGILGFPIFSATVVLIKPCLSIFMSSLILPCDTQDGVQLWTNGGQLTIALTLAVLEGYYINQILTSGTLINMNINLYCVGSLRTFLLGATGENR